MKVYKSLALIAVVCLLGALTSLVWAQGPMAWPGATAPGPYTPAVPLIPPTTGVPGTPGMIALPSGSVVDPGDLVVRVIELKYMNPALVAALFGGLAIYDISSSGARGGGYGGYGGYGSTGYGSTGYGNAGYGYGNTGYRGSRGYGSDRGYSSGRTARGGIPGDRYTY